MLRGIGILAFALGFAFAMPARGELPSPRLDRIFPLGTSAGGEVEVEIQGSDLDDVTGLWADHPGIKAAAAEEKEPEKPGEKKKPKTKFKVSVAADVPPGTYDLRAVGRFGISNPRLFAVSQGLAEVLEKEPNSEAEKAQEVPVNAAVQGQSDGNNEDLYRVKLRAGQRVVIACESGKLDTPMDAQLAVADASGRPLATSGDYEGRDPLVDLIAPAEGDYLVSVSDLSFRGGYPYRLVITDGPHIENLFPRAVQAGKATELVALGRNFGSGSSPSLLKINDLALDELRFSATPPDDIFPLGAFRFSEHPTGHSVLATACTATLTGFQPRPVIGGKSIAAPPLFVTDQEVSLEAEPNDTREQPQEIKLPLVLAGRFDKPRDADWFAFEAPASGSFGVDVYCERIAGRADPFVLILDDKENRVSELDDYGHRTNAFDAHLRDPSGTVNLTEKKRYRVLVQDRYGRGGARYQYVLTLRPALADFSVAVIHSQNPGPAGLNIWRGGAMALDVVIHHREGHNGPVTLTAEGLPPGLHAAPTTIPGGQTSGAFVLWADDNAAEWTGAIKLFAEGQRGDAKLRREVRATTRITTDPGFSASRPVRELAAAIRETAPFSLAFEPERIEIEQGQKGEVKLKLIRRAADFKSEVNVLAVQHPGSVKMQLNRFAGDTLEMTVPIEIQTGTRPGDSTLTVVGQAQVPFAKDQEAKERPNTLVTLPARPVTVVVKEAKNK